MYRKIKLALLISSVALLSACGGGGGSGASPVQEVPVVPVVIAPVFQAVLNIPTITTTFEQLSTLHAIPIDINGDGKDDLVMASASFMYSGSTVGSNVICPNFLTVLISQADGTLKDETATYIPGGTDIGGCARKAKLADINGDGKLDIVFAVNQEDGRATNNPHNADGQLAALVSKGGIYEVKKFGVSSWYHSVGVGYDTNNTSFVVGNGYSSNATTAFKFDSSNNISTISSLPTTSPNTFEFFNVDGSKTESKFLLQAANTNLAYTSIEGYVKNISGSWDKLSDLALAPQIGTVQGVVWNVGAVPDTNPVFSSNGKAITFAGFSESCTMKLTPTSPQMTIFKLSGAIIPNFVNGMTLNQTNLDPFTALYGVSIINGVITSIPLNITNEQTVGVNSNFFDCKDVTGDGYADIVVYPYNTTGMPYVYANNKLGGFDYMGSKMFPVINDSWSSAVSSLLNDFDKDGKFELLVWPANGLLNTVKSYIPHFYKGISLLRAD